MKPSPDLSTLSNGGISNCLVMVISRKLYIVPVKEVGSHFSPITYSQEPKKEASSTSSAGQYRHDVGKKMCLSSSLNLALP